MHVSDAGDPVRGLQGHRDAPRGAARRHGEGQNTSQPLSGDFATWTSGIEHESSSDNANANRVASDCAAWDVTIFPPTSAAATPTTQAPPPAQTVTCQVSGSDANVTYGPAGSSLTGSVPMKVTQKLGDPVYYALQAQLQGGGSVTVKILVNGTVVSQGTTTGGYNIAMAEIVENPLSDQWTGANQG